MIGKKPSTTTCIAGHEDTYQMEFEFLRTGGRIIHYEPFDLFTDAPITLSQPGADPLIVADSGHGESLRRYFRLHFIDADHLQFSRESETGNPFDPTESPVTLFKCGEADHAVNAAASLAQLAVLTSSSGVTIEFAESLGRATDAEICRGLAREGLSSGKGWLQFEVYGPVHYYVFGTIHDPSWRSRLDLSPIRSITSVDEKTLKLEVADRATGDGTWSGGPDAKTYEMTTIWDGRRIRIPEMNREFVRCRTEGTKDEDLRIVPAPL